MGRGVTGARTGHLHTPLIHYLIRRLAMMLNPFLEQHLHAEVHERQRQAEAANRARRLLAVRRWEKRAKLADRRVRLARLAVSQP